MTIKEAWEHLPAYLADELDPQIKAELTALLPHSAELREALELTKRIDVALREPTWVEPSSQFTRAVMRRSGLRSSSNVPAWVRNWEPAKVLVSLAMAAMIVTWLGSELLQTAGRFISAAGRWLDGVVGTTLFTAHPEFMLILAIPVLAAAVTAILVSRGWRTD